MATNNAETTLVFAYPVTTPILNSLPDTISHYHNLIQSLHPSLAVSPPTAATPTADPAIRTLAFSLSLSGLPTSVMLLKARVLRANPSLAQTRLSLHKFHLINPATNQLKPHVKLRFDDISKHTDCTISVLADSDDQLTLEITGPVSRLAQTRQDLAVFHDELAGLHITRISVDLRLLPLICGKDRKRFEDLKGVRVYLPQKSSSSQQSPTIPTQHEQTTGIWTGESDDIVIVGDPESVTSAHEILTQIISTVSKNPIIKQTTSVSRKLDFLHHTPTLLPSIESSNGVSIIMPPICTNTNSVAFIGIDSVGVERAIRGVMRAICRFVVACLTMTSIKGKGMGFLEELVRDVDAEVILHDNFVEVCGEEEGVKKILMGMIGNEVFRSIKDSKFQCELALEHRDFINGKKNGKINKIIKSCVGAKVAFQDNFNGYNMLIELANPNLSKALEGLKLLEDEMPAEISFHVPELYHKRIIGVGGKNIQRIMKKYGVYVKFSNSIEHAQLGGYFSNEDNVIARTPMKNQANLLELKGEIMEICGGKDQEERDYKLIIPRQFHPLLTHLTNELIQKFSVTIKFPTPESGSDTLLVHSTLTEFNQISKSIREITPKLVGLDIPYTQSTLTFLSSDTWKQYSEENDYRIYIPTIQTPELINEREYCISLMCWCVESEGVKEGLIEFLKSNDIQLNKRINEIIPVSRTSSYDSFQHFNNKVFGGVSDNHPPKSASSYSLFDGANTGFEIRPSINTNTTTKKQIQSAPNLRLLFDEEYDVVDSMDVLGSTLAATSLGGRFWEDIQNGDEEVDKQVWKKGGSLFNPNAPSFMPGQK